ncbi:hypothetical protein K9U02_02100 [Xanthomonas arboricola pv. pruni]|uniref:hypothetical protein n=1 Tax=Xanthomonas arboricola TaxID=56448 RepID=UPI001F38C4D4|nr:hypothetical protein [Xanthomonas arboricola]UJO08868.1 hypothetical protein K9U02_02100 [Xanthomonas arboricola pv. pruni]
MDIDTRYETSASERDLHRIGTALRGLSVHAILCVIVCDAFVSSVISFHAVVSDSLKMSDVESQWLPAASASLLKMDGG